MSFLAFREGTGPQGRGRRSPGLSCATPAFARACQCRLNAKLPTLSRLRVAYTCVIFFSSLKIRLNSPAQTASRLVEPLQGPPPTFKVILEPTHPLELWEVQQSWTF